MRLILPVLLLHTIRAQVEENCERDDCLKDCLSHVQFGPLSWPECNLIKSQVPPKFHPQIAIRYPSKLYYILYPTLPVPNLDDTQSKSMQPFPSISSLSDNLLNPYLLCLIFLVDFQQQKIQWDINLYDILNGNGMEWYGEEWNEEIQ